MTYRISILLLPLLFFSCDRKDHAGVNNRTNQSGNIPAQTVETPDYSGNNALFHALRLTSFGQRHPGSPGAAKQLAYLKEILRNHGWSVLEQTFTKTTPAGEKNFVNLRARFGKQAAFSTPPAGLVTCHIDTKTGIPGFLGANDGASGAGALLELSRLFAFHPEQASRLELVFFDGEESFGLHITTADGLYGSRHYAESMGSQFPKWMVNLDMVGRQGMRIRIPSDTPQPFYQLYSQAIDELKLPSFSWGVSSMTIVDDHVPFQQRGIPALNIIDDFSKGNWWHTSHDSPDILSADSLQQTGRMVLRLCDILLSPGSPYPH